MIIDVFVQNEKGSRFRSKFNEKTLEFIREDKLLAPAEYQYGFIPGTLGEDGDCIDVWLISEQDFEIGTIVRCRVVGLLEMTEEDSHERQEDFKIIVCPENDKTDPAPSVINELKEYTLKIFKKFPEIKVSFGSFLRAEAAESFILQNRKMYSITISTNKISAAFKTLGGELTSLKTNDGHEYLWQGDPDYWSGQSPLLFPIIGALPDDSYEYSGTNYKMQKHGFARNLEWTIISHTHNKAQLSLEADGETRRIYPFNFKLSLVYTVFDSNLKVEYTVENLDNKSMPFQIGGHPAFNCPIEDSPDQAGNFLDYKLVFEKEENVHRLLKEDLLTGETEQCIKNANTLDLTHSLFDRDALIFRDLKSEAVCLQRKDGRGRKVKMRFPGFTHFGIWKKPESDASFICLEPWYGVDSTKGESIAFIDKEGVIILRPGCTFCSEYFIEIS